jgi:hypothetical protein
VTTFRSEDWSVHPAFVPNGATSPVALLSDETGLTQLTGIPAVAWQTPWSEIGDIELVRFARHMALFATIGNVRYCWKHRTIEDFEAMRALVLEHGGRITHRRRKSGVVVVVGAVLLASLAGGIASWVNSGNKVNSELADARAANLTLKDLPSGWYKTETGVLSALVLKSTTVVTGTPVKAPAKDSPFEIIAHKFQSCLGVSNANDRIYGKAGQYADYQVSSPIFNTNSLGGMEVASTSQYYATTTMVDKDTHEMSKDGFGPCLATSAASLLLRGSGLSTSSTAAPTNWTPVTFLKGFARGGYVPLTVPGVKSKLDLVEEVVTSGHYEITLDALVGSFPKAESLLASLIETLLLRTSSSTSTAA